MTICLFFPFPDLGVVECGYNSVIQEVRQERQEFETRVGYVGFWFYFVLFCFKAIKHTHVNTHTKKERRKRRKEKTAVARAQLYLGGGGQQSGLLHKVFSQNKLSGRMLA